MSLTKSGAGREENELCSSPCSVCEGHSIASGGKISEEDFQASGDAKKSKERRYRFRLGVLTPIRQRRKKGEHRGGEGKPRENGPQGCPSGKMSQSVVEKSRTRRKKAGLFLGKQDLLRKVSLGLQKLETE